MFDVDPVAVAGFRLCSSVRVKSRSPSAIATLCRSFTLSARIFSTTSSAESRGEASRSSMKRKAWEANLMKSSSVPLLFQKIVKRSVSWLQSN